MKPKFLKRIILAFAALGCVALLGGCKPNVPAKNGETTDITTLPRSTTTPHTTENAGEETNGNMDENDNGTTAVEGNTPTADFDEVLDNQQFLSFRNDNAHLSDKLVGWGLGREVDASNRPVDALKAQKQYGRYGAMFIGADSDKPAKVIYLTFDEGYENGYTAEILDVLKEKGVKATFFVTYDYCKSAEALTAQMINDGHAVGNHSYTHPSFPEAGAERAREELSKLHAYVKDKFGYEMTLARFPKGEFSEATLAAAQDIGYKSVFWSFAHRDWDVNSQPDPAAALAKIKASTHPGGIYLLHAVSRTNAEILSELIDYWHSEGYKLTIF